MKKIAFIFILFSRLTCFSQETFPVNGTFNKNHNYYAFVNAKIIVDYQTSLDSATLLIKEGLIIESGKSVKIPKGAIIYDLKGKHIYPSFIEMFSNYGMPEVKKAQGRMGPQMQSNTKGAYNWNQAVKPETDAFRQFTSDAKGAENMRKLGFGIILTSQADGIVRGSATLVSLGEGMENELIITEASEHFPKYYNADDSMSQKQTEGDRA